MSDKGVGGPTGSSTLWNNNIKAVKSIVHILQTIKFYIYRCVYYVLTVFVLFLYFSFHFNPPFPYLAHFHQQTAEMFHSIEGNLLYVLNVVICFQDFVLYSDNRLYEVPRLDHQSDQQFSFCLKAVTYSCALKLDPPCLIDRL